MSETTVNQETGCWEYNGVTTEKGYGRISHNGKKFRVHRLSFFTFVGDVPDGIMVCHTCDNRLCVNPHHLWLGSAGDNVSDMMSKGRFVSYDKSGERNPSAKLTREQAMEVRRRALAGEHQGLIASAYGVSSKLVSEIKRGRVWA